MNDRLPLIAQLMLNLAMWPEVASQKVEMGY
jgi:hypothetical protein